MRSVLALASIASLSSVALAQTGYGRFPCNIFNGDGTLSADPNQCLDSALIPPGSADDSGFQGDGVTPTNPECVAFGANLGFFCGIAGATCTTDDNCDNGVCTGGVCTGALSATCGADAECLGFLYCTDPTGENVIGSCGGDGAFCTDPSAANPDASAADNFDIYNQYCASGFCSVNNGGVCSEFVTQVDGDCSFDPEFACTVDANTGAALTCDATSLTCQLAPQPTGARARARRARVNGAALFKRRACPLSHTACAISGAKGFECVDTQSNLEQCGACSTEGGVDCTSLPGVESVGCMAGVCEIWSCADGYSFDSASSACVATLA
ncbi:hypothetical protein JCM8208_004104 [Rhodotorula glutinis]